MPSSISKSRDLLCNTPSPGQWLSKRLAELDKTQRWLAHEIGYDTTQVNKWISGRERIPNKALMMAGASLGGSDFEVARNILVINTLIEGLPNDALKATQSNAETSFALAKALAQNAEDSATQLSSEESDRLIYLQSHLATASEVLMMTSQCVAGSDDLIREANVRKHLCFPFNVMTGELMRFARREEAQLGQIDFLMMKNIRKTAKTAGSGLAQAYCQQHAYHLLGRYGTILDRGFMDELIETRRDVITRRTAHYGAIFAATNPLAADKFIFELRRDEQLEQINLDFDFFHYGDKELGAERPKNGVGRTIRNNLRHIESRRGAPTTEIAFHKLRSILAAFGLSQFETKRIKERVEATLRRIQDTDSSRRTPMEAEFLTSFGNLSPFRPLTTVQLFFPGFE